MDSDDEDLDLPGTVPHRRGHLKQVCASFLQLQFLLTGESKAPVDDREEVEEDEPVDPKAE